MVLTAVQRSAFFQDTNQLCISAKMFNQLANKGIINENDLVDFDETSIKQIAKILRRPPGGAEPFVFGAKTQDRLSHACNLMHYYNSTGRETTAANLCWTHVMRNFLISWKAIENKKENRDDPEVPKISRALPIMKWTEVFPNFLRQVFGTRMIPLIYVICPVEAVTALTPPLATNQPFSTLHGSVQDELIARASHNHVLFCDDNAKVYYKLEEATRGTNYSDSLRPFYRAKDSRGAYLSLIHQSCGEDEWDS